MARRPIAFYYGADEVPALSTYERVVLQPERHGPEELATLRRNGVRTLAYLSLGQDPGPPAAWQRGPRDATWNTVGVRPDHPGWVASRTSAARESLEAGFAGLFLDTLDLADRYPDARAGMLALVCRLRAVAGSAYLLANRGLTLWPELAHLVDGVVFESFSACWTDGGGRCRRRPAAARRGDAAWARQVRNRGLDAFALDYVDSPGLSVYAALRAARHGLGWTASDRTLTRLRRARA
jgi:polysaccharide biosynthesis protein PelA